MTIDTQQKKKKLLQQLKALKSFSNTKAVRQLRKELEAKLRQVEKKAVTEPPAKHRQTRLPMSKATTRKIASETRSAKLKKYHNYVRQIHNTYPDLPYAQIRRQFAVRRRGKPSKIPDVIWRNPSP